LEKLEKIRMINCKLDKLDETIFLFQAFKSKRILNTQLLPKYRLLLNQKKQIFAEIGFLKYPQLLIFPLTPPNP